MKEGATLKVYIDGVQVGVTYPAAAPMIQGPGNLYIGRSPSYRPVNALIDEVKLYNYALTASDIETEFIEGDNQPPEADAGEDQIGIEATSPAGAEVTLDGTGSDDPDEDTLTYVWTGVFGSTTGPTPTVTVPLGSHEITLTVDDGNGETSDDTVNVSVLDTTAPEITAPPDIVLAASGPITSVDLGTPTVSDLVDPAPSVDNDAPPGFPVGVTVVTWTATDANSNPAQAEQTVTVTNDPPVANAGFDPIKVEDDEGTFAIVAGGSDPNNNLASVTAVILTPSLDGLEVKLKTKSLVKVSFDLEDGEVKIEGPDPQAILDQIENLGGILVENGQITKIELDDDGEEATFKFDKNGDLKIEAGAVVLMVTATDAEGESGTATASPDFGSEEDDDEDDDEDEDDEDEDDDD